MKNTYKTLSTKVTKLQHNSNKVSPSNKEMAPKFYQSVCQSFQFVSQSPLNLTRFVLIVCRQSVCQSE